VRLADKHKPDVAILDLTLPLLNGLDAAREIRKLSPDTKLIILTRHTEEQYVVEGLRRGSTVSPEDKGGVNPCPGDPGRVRRRALREPRPLARRAPRLSRREELRTSPLSGREREVLQLIAEGKTMKEIAASSASASRPSRPTGRGSWESSISTNGRPCPLCHPPGDDRGLRPGVHPSSAGFATSGASPVCRTFSPSDVIAAGHGAAASSCPPP